MNMIEKYFGQTEEKKKAEAAETAAELYQVREYKGELWVTYNACLVCPSSMLKDDPVEAVRKMRELYVDRV